MSSHPKVKVLLCRYTECQHCRVTARARDCALINGGTQHFDDANNSKNNRFPASPEGIIMAGQIFNIMRILQKNHYHHSNRTTGGSVNVYGGGSVQHRPSHTKRRVQDCIGRRLFSSTTHIVFSAPASPLPHHQSSPEKRGARCHCRRSSLSVARCYHSTLTQCSFQLHKFPYLLWDSIFFIFFFFPRLPTQGCSLKGQLTS